MGVAVKSTLTFGCFLALSGCMNMSTQPSQITGSYISTLRYEPFDCNRLALERDDLVERERKLAMAQEQRVKSSQMQAFWIGYGQGDGIEAAELASVRGQLDAGRKTMALKSCQN